MKKTCVITVWLIATGFLCQLFGQKHDQVWVMGYDLGSSHPDLGRIVMDFQGDSISFSEGESVIDLFSANASISDTEGNLMFYTNGIKVLDANHNLMENGDSLTDNEVTLSATALNLPQAVLILPLPEDDSIYYIFHEPVDFDQTGVLGAYVPELAYSVVDMKKNGGLGKVTIKNEQIIEDTLATGKLTATKHANGRDWWILVPETEELVQNYYALLLSPEGIVDMGIQSPGPGMTFDVGSVGNALFTPDGTKYIRQDIRFDPWNVIDIYNFDRCSGELVHVEHFEVADESFLYGGAAVSPDSRYLYVVTNRKIWQYDLTAQDIEATGTLVGEFDGHISYWFESTFGTPQVGPDGKIYITSAVSDTVMHVLNTPNHLGTASNLAQHSINLPNLNDKSIPNFPNYRLGSLDGSPCDTLGIDNHPMAGFTYHVDELTVTFSDNSFYRSEEWEWDFGDSNSSMERNPAHGYAEPGTYLVCLTVRNEIDEDTYCRFTQVDTMVVDVLEKQGQGKVVVYPNPTRGQINLQIKLPSTKLDNFSLLDMTGRVVKSWNISGERGYYTLPVFDISDGLYFWKIENRGRTLRNGKVMIID